MYNGSRWERSFTAGPTVCYRGHKSAAWHRVSSARQQSQTSGIQSTSKQTNWQHETQKTEAPKDYDQLGWDMRHRGGRHRSRFRRGGRTQEHEWTSKKRETIYADQPLKWGNNISRAVYHGRFNMLLHIQYRLAGKLFISLPLALNSDTLRLLSCGQIWLQQRG